MSEGVPETFPIDHDDYHARHVGRTADGRQFFLTTPFRPKLGTDPGREFIALYLFDDEGRLIEATIDDFGVRSEVDEVAYARTREQRLASLGEVEYGRIVVRPFQLERFGTTFGLIPNPPGVDTDEDDPWCITLEPGDYMAFFPPWDGDYDT